MPCSSACSIMAENPLRYQRKYCHFDVLAARKKTHKKACFCYSYSVTPPHPTAKPSCQAGVWGWLRVGVRRKPRLVLTEFAATWNIVTATPRSYWRGCPGAHHRRGSSHGSAFICVFIYRAVAEPFSLFLFTKTKIDGASENWVVAPATGPRCARGPLPSSSHASVA